MCFICACVCSIKCVFLHSCASVVLYMDIWQFYNSLHKNLKFSIKYFFSKCDQIRRELRIWSHLLKRSIMEIFIFCAVIVLFSIIYFYRLSCIYKQLLENKGLSPPPKSILKKLTNSFRIKRVLMEYYL